MTRMIGVTFGLAAGTLLGSAALAQEPRASIEAGNKQFAAAFLKGDGAAVAALYTPNAQLLPANSEAVSGTAAIQKFWQGVIDSGVRGAKLTAVEVEGHGNTAHEVGQYELSDKAGKLLDRGKYVVIWKRDGSQWKLHRDIWTTSQPPAAP
jgi:ketosteroid isomerase-like protein